jgi:stage V sporulation protein AC
MSNQGEITQTKLTKEEYGEMVKAASPNSKIIGNCAKAFVVGGLICVFGEFLLKGLESGLFGMKFSQDNAAMYTTVLLILIATVLTGFGIYEKLGKFAGAGSIVPITGFANSIAAPAIEFKKEGYIFGVGAKMFLLAGPVLVYGTFTSVIVGIIYYLYK